MLLRKRFFGLRQPPCLPASQHGLLGRPAAGNARAPTRSAAQRPCPRRSAACAQGAPRRRARGPHPGRCLLPGDDARTVELEPRHPLGRVAARPRRGRARLEGRVDLLLAERARQGRPGAARAALTPGSQRPRRPRARPARSSTARRAITPLASRPLPGEGVWSPTLHGREPHRPRSACHDLPQRPRRIPAADRGRGVDQHLADEDLAVRRPPGARRGNATPRTDGGAGFDAVAADRDVQQRLQARRLARRLGAGRAHLRADARRPGDVRPLHGRPLRRDRLARRAERRPRTSSSPARTCRCSSKPDTTARVSATARNGARRSETRSGCGARASASTPTATCSTRPRTTRPRAASPTSSSAPAPCARWSWTSTPTGSASTPTPSSGALHPGEAARRNRTARDALPGT